ncbi:unnamed protein product, partial [Ectocarpus fasciculatus]
SGRGRGWARQGEHGAMDVRRAPALPAGAGTARQGVEEDRVAHQDEDGGANPDPCAEVLPEDRQGQAERGAWGRGHGLEGTRVSQKKQRAEKNGRPAEGIDGGGAFPAALRGRGRGGGDRALPLPIPYLNTGPGKATSCGGTG